MAEMIKVAKKSDILPGEVRAFVVGTEMVAICNLDGEFHAIKDECTHQAYPLSDGVLDGDVIVCAYHGAEFNVKDGDVLCMPATDPVETFEVEVDGDDIYILMEEY